MSRPSIQTKKGYDMFEVSSALQKSIRRGMEKEALYWAHELVQSNYHNYLWKRLAIVAVEDIGPADPDAIVRVMAMKQAFYDEKENKGGGTLFYVSAVMLMCRSHKSRLWDWATCSMLASHNRRAEDIPDFAIDKHTRRGKMMGRGRDHFLKEGTKLHPHKTQPGEEELKQETMLLWDDKSEAEHAALPHNHKDRAKGSVPTDSDEGVTGRFPIGASDEGPRVRTKKRRRTAAEAELDFGK
jgi:replication-associated recombination protein RarA